MLNISWTRFAQTLAKVHLLRKKTKINHDSWLTVFFPFFVQLLANSGDGSVVVAVEVSTSRDHTYEHSDYWAYYINWKRCWRQCQCNSAQHWKTWKIKSDADRWLLSHQQWQITQNKLLENTNSTHFAFCTIWQFISRSSKKTTKNSRSSYTQ